MKHFRCYLRGAYGPGNLGDDVLMVAIYRLLRERFNTEDIAIGVEDIKIGAKLLPEATFVHYKMPFSADLVVLGGGGQFFEFHGDGMKQDNGKIAKIFSAIQKQSGLFAAIERLIISSQPAAIDRLFIAKKIAAYCIGLGPFDSNGRGVTRAESVIPRLNYISVRDHKSSELAVRFGATTNPKIFSDPTFDVASWNDTSVVESQENEGYSFILRDWPHSRHGANLIKTMIEVARQLRDKGEVVRLVSLYAERDQHLIKSNNDFVWLTWSPLSHTISEFLGKLIQSKVILSSRAHGVLLPAILGEPSIAIEIEPKLRNIHAMLPNSTVLCGESEPEKLLKCIRDFESRKTVLKHRIKEELNEQNLSALTAKEDFLQWLDSHCA